MLQEHIRLTSVVLFGLILGIMGCSGSGSDGPTQVVVPAANAEDATGSNSESASNDAGAEAGADADADADAGTTGTDTDGSDTDTNGYPVGSLANLLENEADLSMALAALQAAGIDQEINSLANEWTLFLPTNEAFENLNSQADFVLQRHINKSDAHTIQRLLDSSGLGLVMEDGRSLTLYDGGGEDLSIADANVIRGDITGNTSTTTVHVIDKVIGEYTGPVFSPGSLADKLYTRGDMFKVLDLLIAEDGRDITLINRDFNWTLFLPNDAALENSQNEFFGDNHIFEFSVLTSTNLTGMSGTSIQMFSGDLFEIGGGGTEPLTIGGIEILETDLQRDDMDGAIVHIINGVLVPEPSEGD